MLTTQPLPPAATEMLPATKSIVNVQSHVAAYFPGYSIIVTQSQKINLHVNTLLEPTEVICRLALFNDEWFHGQKRVVMLNNEYRLALCDDSVCITANYNQAV